MKTTGVFKKKKKSDKKAGMCGHTTEEEHFTSGSPHE